MQGSQGSYLVWSDVSQARETGGATVLLTVAQGSTVELVAGQVVRADLVVPHSGGQRITRPWTTKVVYRIHPPSLGDDAETPLRVQFSQRFRAVAMGAPLVDGEEFACLIDDTLALVAGPMIVTSTGSA